ncbi:MAG: hypothetical protein ACXVY9_06400 [Terriglobales bacterium]
MPRTRRWIVLGLLLAGPLLLAQNAALSEHASAPHRKSHKAKTPLVLPPLPGGPLSQLPMDQIPATPAKVSYQGGLLTISAQNSTLGEILRDVRKVTGASIEIPSGSGAGERVVTHLGPAAPRDVLAGLLNGSSFNYVMLGSSSDPNAVSSVILTPKPSAAGETQTAATLPPNNPGVMPPNRFPPPQPFNQSAVVPQPGNVQAATAEADDSAQNDEQDNAEENADEQAQPGQPGQPEMNGGNPPDQEQQPDPTQPNAGPKTPEQILEMLRRQQPGGPVFTNPQPPPQPPPQ